MQQSQSTLRRALIGGLYCLIVLAMIGYVLSFLKDAAWIIGDEGQFLTTTLIGKRMPILIWPASGRFWPLGLYDYNLLIPVGNNPIAYYLYSSAKFGICVLFLWLSLRLITDDHLLLSLSVLLFLSTPTLFRIFSDIVYAEQSICLLLSAFAYCYLKCVRNRSLPFGLATVLISTLATYVKEPVFAAFTIFGVSGMFLLDHEKRRFMRPVHIALIVNAIIFVNVYYFVSFRHMSRSYAVPNAVLSEAWNGDPLLFIMLAVALVRGYSTVFLKDRSHVIPDIFLFSASVYFLCFVVLGMFEPHYFMPFHVFLTIAFCGYVADLFKLHKVSWAIVLLIISFAVNLSQTPKVYDSITSIHETRKSDSIHIRTLRQYLDGGYEILFLNPGGPAKVPSTWWRYRVLSTFIRFNWKPATFPVTHSIAIRPKQILVTPVDLSIESHDLIRMMTMFDLSFYCKRR